MDNKTSAQTVRLVRSAWNSLPYLQGQSFRDGRDVMRDKYVAEEKAHRKYAPNSVRHPATVTDAALCLAVHDIAGFLVKPEPAAWAHLLSRRESWLLAAAFTEVNAAEIRTAWKAFDLQALQALDYADLCNAE